MFEQKGAVLAGCESAQLSDLSNVYRDFWQVSRTTDKWNSFCLFIDEAYRQQSAQVTYPLYSIGPGGTPGPIHGLRLHSHVLTKLLPLIRELEDRQYMQRIRIRWIVGDLLELFLRNPGQTLPRETILLRVWGMDCDVEDGNLDNYTYFLRRSLRKVGSRLQLATVRGVGYRLEDRHG
jgi:hypothetical protein